MRGLLLVLAATGCSKVTCGEGTELVDKECVAVDDTGGNNGPVVYASMTGTVDYYITSGADTVCDATIALTGTHAPTRCEGCDFVFDVDATITEDNSSSDCTYYTQLSYIEDVLYGPVMAYGQNPFGDTGPAFATGFYYDNYYGETGSYWYYVDNPTTGTFSWEGDTIDWSFELSYYTDQPLLVDDCGDFWDELWGTELAGGASVTEDLPCTGGVADIWEFTATAGDTISLSVDTVSEATAFDPRFYVNDGTGCTIASSDDALDCTYPPPLFSCPAGEFTVDTTGTHQVIVSMGFPCDSSAGDYVLNVQSEDGNDITLTQVEEDIAEYETIEVVIGATGTATLSQ